MALSMMGKATWHTLRSIRYCILRSVRHVVYIIHGLHVLPESAKNHKLMRFRIFFFLTFVPGLSVILTWPKSRFPAFLARSSISQFQVSKAVIVLKTMPLTRSKQLLGPLGSCRMANA